MGGKSSKKGAPRTPLQCMLDNFKAGYFRDYGNLVADPFHLKRFCESEWPTFGVGWPTTGSWDPELVSRVHQIVTGNGYWDQYPYIDQWQINVEERPPMVNQMSARVRYGLFNETQTRGGKEDLNVKNLKPGREGGITMTPLHIILDKDQLDQ
uniref:Gamma-retroviral matrix protein domain-containing protein n=1 Tax=Micrurus paraensis TaxID=1970185 RepID=A0A2D4K5B6_9SAUR